MKYEIIMTSAFRKELKIIKKKKKDLSRLTNIVNKLAIYSLRTGLINKLSF